ICPFCGCGCTLTLGIREGRILRSRGKEDSGVSEGNLCGRGRFGFDYIYSENRLKTPMIRKNGDFVPVLWDEALNYISDRLRAVIQAHGPQSVGAIGSHRCTNEDNYMLQKFMRNVIGSNNIDSSASFGYARVEKAWEMAFGQKNHIIDLKSPLGKEVILILESDLSITHPVFGLNILRAKREGSHLIVADCRDTKLTRHSSKQLRIKQGTGVAFLNGIMKIIIDKGLFDRDRASKIHGFSSLQTTLKDYNSEKIALDTGIPEGDLVSVAETFARARSRLLSFSVSVSENTKGMDTVLAAANLIILLGDNHDVLQIPAEYSNTFGLHQTGVIADCGLQIADLNQKSKIKNQKSHKGILEMLYEPASLNALYIMGEDPVITFPNSAKIMSRLKSLDLLVVQDIALTETAKCAHVVLPASSWAEKEGTLTNAEGITQRLYKTVNQTGQSLPDWQIVKNLAFSMGKDIGVSSIGDITEEIKKASPEKVRGSDRRVFNPGHYSQGEEPDTEYPLSLVIRDILQHSGSMSTRSKSLDLVVSEAILEINRKDAKKHGVLDNSYVKLTSRRGNVYLKANVSEDVPEGTVFAPVHFPHAGISNLTYPSSDGTSSLNAVRIEPVK
ncbi:MAG: molybdopterin-dependent oxidoreductase, partial [Candidatus Mariimomonas ferrooxydans]